MNYQGWWCSAHLYSQNSLHVSNCTKANYDAHRFKYLVSIYRLVTALQEAFHIFSTTSFGVILHRYLWHDMEQTKIKMCTVHNAKNKCICTRLTHPSIPVQTFQQAAQKNSLILPCLEIHEFLVFPLVMWSAFLKLQGDRLQNKLTSFQMSALLYYSHKSQPKGKDSRHHYSPSCSQTTAQPKSNQNVKWSFLTIKTTNWVPPTPTKISRAQCLMCNKNVQPHSTNNGISTKLLQNLLPLVEKISDPWACVQTSNVQRHHSQNVLSGTWFCGH